MYPGLRLTVGAMVIENGPSIDGGIFLDVAQSTRDWASFKSIFKCRLKMSETGDD